MNTAPQKLHVDVMGQGQDLVLVHGWGVNSAVWHPLCEQLKHHFRLHLVDLPGFGNSSFHPVESFEDYVSLIAQAVPEGAWWLGWSLGGLIAQHAAMHKAVGRLILVASTPKFVQTPDWSGIRPDILEQFSRQLNGDTGKTLSRFLAIQAMGSESARQDVKRISQAVQSRPLPVKEALTLGLALLRDVDLRDQVSGIKCPVSLTFGRLDTLVPFAAISPIVDCFANAETHIFEHASHAPFISHCDAFASWLLDQKPA